MQNLYVFFYHDCEDVYCCAVTDKKKFDLLSQLNSELIIVLLDNSCAIEEYKDEQWYEEYAKFPQETKDFLMDHSSKVRSIHDIESLNRYINTYDAVIKETVDLGICS